MGRLWPARRHDTEIKFIIIIIIIFIILCEKIEDAYSWKPEWTPGKISKRPILSRQQDSVTTLKAEIPSSFCSVRKKLSAITEEIEKKISASKSRFEPMAELHRATMTELT